MELELLPFYVACLLLAVFSYHLLGLLADRRRNLPPGPAPLPLVGNLLSLGAHPHRSLARLAERHGPVMTLRLGTVTTVVASSADAAREFLQRHDAACSGRFLFDGTHAFAHYAHSMVWLPASSPRWRALRKVCSGELFAPHRLDTNHLLRRDKVRELVAHVARLASEGEPVRVGRLAFTTALNLLSSTFFSADLAESDIAQLKYLQAVVKETFRLHPPAPFLLPHLADATTQVRGYTVPRGARILVNVWAIGRDAQAWPEPEKFMPERFLLAEKEVDFRGRDFELLPFGSGRRMCPGMPLAVRMVHLVLASLLHRFHWSLRRMFRRTGSTWMRGSGSTCPWLRHCRL